MEGRSRGADQPRVCWRSGEKIKGGTEAEDGQEGVCKKEEEEKQKI